MDERRVSWVFDWLPDTMYAIIQVTWGGHFTGAGFLVSAGIRNGRHACMD